jgi:hypothetical protein
VRNPWPVVAVALVAGLVLDLALGLTPLVTAATGLLGSVALVLGAKWLGSRLLKRPESYYGGDHG